MDEQKNKGGRPPIEDRANLRNKVIAVRVTEFGYGKVKELADAKNMKVADYVRLVLIQLAEGKISIR